MIQPVTPAQIRAIQVAARAAGLTDEARRDFMERETGKRSAKELDIRQAIRVIDGLNRLPKTPAAKAKANGALDLDGPYVGPARALWISGHHLGVIHDRSDRAMVAFVERQTRISHLNWVKDPRDGARVIEGLKGWLERAAGVAWKDHDQDARGRKLAVYLAIRRMLTAAGVDVDFIEFPGRVGARSADEARLDALTAAAGRRLRKARG